MNIHNSIIDLSKHSFKIYSLIVLKCRKNRIKFGCTLYIFKLLVPSAGKQKMLCNLDGHQHQTTTRERRHCYANYEQLPTPRSRSEVAVTISFGEIQERTDSTASVNIWTP